jgi:hypothetical protein
MNASKYSIFNQEEKEAYIETKELEKLERPDSDYKKALTDLKMNDQWNKQFDACNTIRRACVHHHHFLTTSALALHNIVLDVIIIIFSILFIIFI